MARNFGISPVKNDTRHETTVNSRDENNKTTHKTDRAITTDKKGRVKTTVEEFKKTLKEDITLRNFILKRMEFAGVPRVDIERASERIKIILYSSRPGVVIGRRGSEIDKVRDEVAKLTHKNNRDEIDIKIEEIKKPDLNAQLVANNIALQLERRISFRRALKRAMQLTMQNGADEFIMKPFNEDIVREKLEMSGVL